MPNLHKLPQLAILVLLLVAPCVTASAQDNDDRHRAFQLLKEAKYPEAQALFEKLAVANPNDVAVIENLGFLVYHQAAYLPTAEERKQARKRTRELLMKAMQLGSTSPLSAFIDGIPPDGGNDETFSPRKEVDDAMREAEAAFGKGEFPKAIEMYQRALLLDPKLYEAALFIGDVYFKSAEQVKAGEWFARAIEINPDRETAYRYWADSLMTQGKVSEAGDKFAEAYIAEPYNRLARAGLVKWGERVNIALAHPRVEFPAGVSKKDENQTTITLDPNMLDKGAKDGSAAAWMVYSFTRASWATSEFAKQYPNEKTYRHTLKEETTAIRAALKSLDEKKTPITDRSLQILKKLDEEGLLEAYILLAMPDQGIAADFAAYRKTNSENLRRYVKQYVMRGGGQ
jgi:tetratricopeptide (TPR) repeat protein